MHACHSLEGGGGAYSEEEEASAPLAHARNGKKSEISNVASPFREKEAHKGFPYAKYAAWDASMINHVSESSDMSASCKK